MKFTIFTTSELVNYVKNYKWSRKISQLHIHHTWKPNHSDYNGSNGIILQKSMQDHHIKSNGWKDIGQHLTLLPDGKWITGRDFNADPASIQSWNKEAFSIEMLGNFDKGYNKFEGVQAAAMFEFCAFFVMLKKLDVAGSVKFHRDSPSANKTCPGSSIEREWFMNQLNSKVEKLLSPKKDESESKLIVVDKLSAAGIIKEPNIWKEKINEPMPVWAVLTIVNSVFEKLNEQR